MHGPHRLPAPSRCRKRTKAGRYAADVTLEELKSCFHMPTDKACKKLGVGLTILKRICRRFGLQRWPYKKPCKNQWLQGRPAEHGSLRSPQAQSSVPASLPWTSEAGPGLGDWPGMAGDDREESVLSAPQLGCRPAASPPAAAACSSRKSHSAPAKLQEGRAPAVAAAWYGSNPGLDGEQGVEGFTSGRHPDDSWMTHPALDGLDSPYCESKMAALLAAIEQSEFLVSPGAHASNTTTAVERPPRAGNPLWGTREKAAAALAAALEGHGGHPARMPSSFLDTDGWAAVPPGTWGPPMAPEAAGAANMPADAGRWGAPQPCTSASCGERAQRSVLPQVSQGAPIPRASPRNAGSEAPLPPILHLAQMLARSPEMATMLTHAVACELSGAGAPDAPGRQTQAQALVQGSAFLSAAQGGVPEAAAEPTLEDATGAEAAGCRSSILQDLCRVLASVASEGQAACSAPAQAQPHGLKRGRQSQADAPSALQGYSPPPAAALSPAPPAIWTAFGSTSREPYSPPHPRHSSGTQPPGVVYRPIPVPASAATQPHFESALWTACSASWRQQHPQPAEVDINTLHQQPDSMDAAPAPVHPQHQPLAPAFSGPFGPQSHHASAAPALSPKLSTAPPPAVRKCHGSQQPALAQLGSMLPPPPPPRSTAQHAAQHAAPPSKHQRLDGSSVNHAFPWHQSAPAVHVEHGSAPSAVCNLPLDAPATLAKPPSPSPLPNAQCGALHSTSLSPFTTAVPFQTMSPTSQPTLTLSTQPSLPPADLPPPSQPPAVHPTPSSEALPGSWARPYPSAIQPPAPDTAPAAAAAGSAKIDHSHLEGCHHHGHPQQQPQHAQQHASECPSAAGAAAAAEHGQGPHPTQCDPALLHKAAQLLQLLQQRGGLDPSRLGTAPDGAKHQQLLQALAAAIAFRRQQHASAQQEHHAAAARHAQHAAAAQQEHYAAAARQAQHGQHAAVAQHAHRVAAAQQAHHDLPAQHGSAWPEEAAAGWQALLETRAVQKQAMLQQYQAYITTLAAMQRKACVESGASTDAAFGAAPPQHYPHGTNA